jgi:hypothetical protein
MILCYPHHKEIDRDVERYSVPVLLKMKSEHESRFGGNLYKVDESVIDQIEKEQERFWGQIARLNVAHVAPEFAVRIEGPLSPIKLFNKVSESIERILRFTDLLREGDETLDEEARQFLGKLGYDLRQYDAAKYYENPLQNRNWEIHNLGVPNSLTDLGVLLLQLEVQYLVEYLKTHPNENVVEARLVAVRQELAELASTVGYAD